LVKLIERLQKITGAPEACRVPVIAAIHGPCIGAGVDFSAACDLRYCDVSADFSVKEIDLAIVADIGTLQRFPLLVGEQRAKELSYTGRHFSGIEALKMGYVLECFADKEILVQHALDMAKMIASKSPLTIRGIKQTINYQRDHTTADSLYQIKYHNAATILSDDLVQAVTGMTTKSKPTFRQD
jgi:enoyl-CoA hydratase